MEVLSSLYSIHLWQVLSAGKQASAFVYAPSKSYISVPHKYGNTYLIGF